MLRNRSILEKIHETYIGVRRFCTHYTFIIKNSEQKKMWENFVAQEGIDDFLLYNTGYVYFDTMLKILINIYSTC